TMKVFVWQELNTDIPDTTDLKLIILHEKDDEFMKDTMNMRGRTPRVNRNTLFFLTPLESERTGFYNLLKRGIAYRLISDDKTLNLSNEQNKEIKAELKKIEGASNESLRRYYRLLAIPGRDGFNEQDLGIPTYGEAKKIDDLVYEKLRTTGEVLERIVPLVIKERYLKDAKFVLTEQLYQSSARTPGEVRIVDRVVWEDGISEGVREGLFGLGELEGEEPVCRFFGKSTSVALSGSEVIIREDFCNTQEEETDSGRGYLTGTDNTDEAETGIGDSGTVLPIDPEPTVSGKESVRKKIHLKFTLPKGKVAGIMGIMNFLQSKFDRLEIELLAEGGAISESDYDDKIKEAFRQLEIKLNKSA
ncbi:MAG: AAA family ATPase, partial [Euryarchaeota archaeon]|nr:AAA family ATPase [Euryarchaeota archaeon]